MTSFVIGRPPKFSPGAFGDMGVFKAISQVNEQLYICGVMALSEEKVKALKINCVINATLEWPPLQIPGLETVRIKVDDIPSANLSPYFERVADKMNEVISRGGKVLVHCMAGISRSSTLCIAYLMKHKGLSLQQAHSLMRSRRPLIRPNDGFWRQLIQYEKELRRHKQAQKGGVSGEKLVHKTDRHHRSITENPSMTVTRLSSAHPVYQTPKQPSATTQLYNSSATNPRYKQDGRKGYPTFNYHSTPNLLSANRSSSTHRLGTLRSSGSGTVRLQPQPQRDIALSAMKNHWSTTYGSDYTKQPGRRL